MVVDRFCICVKNFLTNFAKPIYKSRKTVYNKYIINY
nr:MAG TPA: hypothetical protein [Caudoviricetes sp.]